MVRVTVSVRVPLDDWTNVEAEAAEERVDFNMSDAQWSDYQRVVTVTYLVARASLIRALREADKDVFGAIASVAGGGALVGLRAVYA